MIKKAYNLLINFLLKKKKSSHNNKNNDELWITKKWFMVKPKQNKTDKHMSPFNLKKVFNN